MLQLTAAYQERIREEQGKSAQQILVDNVGKLDPKRHLETAVADLMGSNLVQCLGTMLDTVVF